MQRISGFRGTHEFLSNFFPCHILYKGVGFGTVEGAFQAAKCANPSDIAQFAGLTPSASKRLGRKVALRPDWEDCKTQVMKELLTLKFAPGTTFARLLLETGDAELVESNTWHDNIWGDCTCPRCANITGQNQLGKLLMEVREELRRHDG